MKKWQLILAALLILMLMPANMVFSQDVAADEVAIDENSSTEDDYINYSVFAGAGLPTIGGILMGVDWSRGLGFSPEFYNTVPLRVTLEVYGGTFFGVPYHAIDVSGMDKIFGFSSVTYWYTLNLDGISIPFGTSFYMEGGSLKDENNHTQKFFAGGLGLRAEAMIDGVPVIPYIHLGWSTGGLDPWVDVLADDYVSPESDDYVSSDSESSLSFNIGARYELDLSGLEGVFAKEEEEEIVPEIPSYIPGLNPYEAVYVSGPFPTEIGATFSSDRVQADVFLNTDWGQPYSTSLVGDVQTVWENYQDENMATIAMGLNARYMLMEIGQREASLHVPIMIGFGADFGWALGSLGGFYLDAKLTAGADFDIAALPWMVPFVNFGIGFGLGLAGTGDLDLDAIGVDSDTYLGLTAYTPYSLQIGVRIPYSRGEKEEEPEAASEPENPNVGIYELPEWLVSTGWHRNPTAMTSQMWSFHFKGKNIKYQSNWRDDPESSATFDDDSFIEVLTNTDTEYSVKVLDENGQEKVLTFVYTEEDPNALILGNVSIEMEGPYLIVNGEDVFGQI